MEHFIIKADILENMKQEISNINETLLTKLKNKKTFYALPNL